MFCKWCGEKIEPEERKCAACGREIPPLSDCGGFYGLTGKDEQRRSAPIDTDVGAPKQEAKRTTKSTGKRIKYRLASKALLVLVPLLLLALFINIQINIAKLTKQGDRIVTALEDIKTEMVGGGTDEVGNEVGDRSTGEGDDGSTDEVDDEVDNEVDNEVDGEDPGDENDLNNEENAAPAPSSTADPSENNDVAGNKPVSPASSSAGNSKTENRSAETN